MGIAVRSTVTGADIQITVGTEGKVATIVIGVWLFNGNYYTNGLTVFVFLNDSAATVIGIVNKKSVIFKVLGVKC